MITQDESDQQHWLTQASNANSAQANEYRDVQNQDLWSGVCFKVEQQQIITPLGDIAEVSPLLSITSLPLTPPWYLGLANLRGRVLSVLDLKQFALSKTTQLHANVKILCFNVGQDCVGLLVDEVLGVKHYKNNTYSAGSNLIAEPYRSFCQGYFLDHSTPVAVLMMSQLYEHDRLKHMFTSNSI